MKKITVFLTVVLFCFSVSAGEKEHYKEGDYPAGKIWNRLSNPKKISMVVGIRAGIDAFYYYSGKEIKENEEMVNVHKQLNPDLPNREIIDRINAFYDDTTNNKVPIYEAYVYACVKKR